jgi:hypothetical protein
MPEISKELVSLLQYLLPGFLVAWVMYGLTSHEKPAQSERIIQALIYSLGVQACVILEKKLLLFIGGWFELAPWNSDSKLLASLSTALMLGCALAHALNRDYLHKFLRKIKISNRSSHPNEWYLALNLNPTYVVLHLKEERRLYGWPFLWPSNPEKGHFLIKSPAWLDDDNREINESGHREFLIDVHDVKWVELIQSTEPENDEQTD